jgi:hypothetical protein
MQTAFLLRYQEFYPVDNVPDIRYGTQTHTMIRSEQPDYDPGGAALVTLPCALGFIRMTSKGEKAAHMLGEAAMQAVLRPTLLPVPQTKPIS